MDLSRGVAELKQQKTLLKEKDDAPGVEDLDSLVDVASVQTSGYGITSVLLSSQEKSATSSANEIMTSPLAPITPYKCQRIHVWQPVQVVHVVSEESEKKGTLQTASVTDSLDVSTGNDFLKLLAPVTPDKSRPIQDYQPHERDLSDGRLSKENDRCMYVKVPPQVEEIKTRGSVQLAETAQNGKEEEEEEEEEVEEEEEEEEIGLIKTPRKNAAKRKKHRPKVMQEGKPAKKPKPIPSANKENPTPKRVYGRRKNILNTPLGADRENMDQCSLKAERSNADQLTKTNTRSVRRSLNFDLVSQEEDGCQLSPVINLESRAQETFAGSTDSCSTKFAVKLTQGLEVVVNKSPVGIAFDLNCSLNQMLEEYITLPERPIMSAQACTGDTVSKQLKNSDDTNRTQTDQGQINSDSHTDAILIEDGTEKIGMKRDSDYIEVTQQPSSYECSREMRLLHVYTKRKGTSKSQVKSNLSLYIPEIHKKRRTQKVKAWRCNKAVWGTSRYFSFADGQSSRTLDCLQDSELMLAISSIMRTTKKRSKIPTRARKPTSMDFIEDSNYLLQTPEKLKESVVTSGSKKYGPQTCMEALFADTRYKLKTKKRTEKEQPHRVSSMPSNMKKEHEVTSFKFQSQHQHFVRGLTTQSTRNFSVRNLNNCQVTSAEDHQLRSNILGPLCVNFQSRAIVPYMNDMDVILHKLKCLNLNEDQVATAKEQNALSHYWGGSAMFPYHHLFGLVKKKHPRARVDLDPETNRVWKVLMGSENIDEDAGQDMDKEKWWEEERQIFRGRIDSFIARMHLIQGDRRFSKWKGSVVDSVVGVFLTQNVSDHLSSSAFMSLAARYPLSSRGENKKSYPERTNVQKEEQDECTLVADDAIKWQEIMSTSEVYDLGSAAVNDSRSIGSNSRYGLHDSEGENLHVDERDQPICLEGSQNNTDTPLNVTGSKNLAEAEDRVSAEEVVSSQNSIRSQGNSLDTLTQTSSQVDSNLELITEADNLLIRSKCCSSECATLFGEHKLVRENITSKESYNDDEGILLAENWACTEDGKETTPLYMLDSSRSSSPSAATSDNLLNYAQNDVKFVQPAASMSYNFHTSSICGSTEMGSIDFGGEESCVPSTSFEFIKTYNTITAEEFGPSKDQKILISESRITSVDSHVSLSKQYAQTQNCSLSNDVSDKPPQVQNVQTAKVQQEEINADFEPENICHVVNIPTQKQHHREEPECPNSCSKLNEDSETSKIDKSSLKDEVCVTNKVEMKSSTSVKKMKAETGKRNFDWDSLRREAFANCDKKERSCEEMDSLDWEAVRCADVNEISKAIRERGMNNVLAGRIKDFLNRLVKDHGSIDLEWLRDVPPDKAKEYLLSVRGLGLKSVECVLLLTLHHLAFPVDTNVGRVSVRLGWVPLQPLPESLQLHLLELYPMIEHIQKYLWPRLCTLDQETLYELHYQMITFGKVFCTKSKPNCNACPMRGDCKHFASAFASARLSLPGPEEKRLVASRVPIVSENDISPSFSSAPQCQIEGNLHQELSVDNNLDPVIEEPPTPEQECSINLESVIEDDFYENPDDIPIIKLNLEEFAENLQNYMQENNVEMEGDDMSKALVALTAEAASIPMPKLKNVSRLRTEHRVYELPDSHPLLEEMDQREHNDPCPYLLVIWTPGETAQSVEPPQSCCSFQRSSGELCDRNTCFACNSIREEHAQTVRGTLLIPCRTAMRGSFPLNGTYFQVNEVFADHTSSCKPIDVPRKWIWNLPRRTVYFGTSVLTIFRGLTTEEIQLCFWRGFVCVRGFDRASRAPKPLFARLHFSASKESNARKRGPNEGQNNTSGTT